MIENNVLMWKCHVCIITILATFRYHTFIDILNCYNNKMSMLHLSIFCTCMSRIWLSLNVLCEVQSGTFKPGKKIHDMKPSNDRERET